MISKQLVTRHVNLIVSSKESESSLNQFPNKVFFQNNVLKNLNISSFGIIDITRQ